MVFSPANLVFGVIREGKGGKSRRPATCVCEESSSTLDDNELFLSDVTSWSSGRLKNGKFLCNSESVAVDVAEAVQIAGFLK